MTHIHAAQEPPAHIAGQLQGLDALELLLAEGWRIDPPVLVRISWAHQRGGAPAYHFILAHDARRSLVVIADSPEVQRFLAERAIAIA